MKLRGTVCRLHDNGEEVEIMLTNVRQVGAAEWRRFYGLTVYATHSAAKAFTIGRVVHVTVTPKAQP